MSQHDYNIANASGAVVRADLNDAFDAVATNNSGGSAPSVTFAHMWWFDSTNGLLKQRDAANTAWVTVAKKTGSTWIALASDGAVGAPGFAFAGELGLGLYRIGAGNLGVAIGGSRVLDVSAAGLLLASGARITAFLDEDNMASDSATAGSTQQAIKAYVDANSSASSLLHVRDEKSSGSDGGGSTSGAWQTRTLNTVLTNEIAGASLASNQITLPAGTFDIEAAAPAKRAQNHKIRLRNITDGADTLIGQNVNSNTDDTSTNANLAPLQGRFTIAGSKVFQIQHRVQVSKATDGFGEAASFGVNEVYTDVRIWKVG